MNSRHIRPALAKPVWPKPLTPGPSRPKDFEQLLPKGQEWFTPKELGSLLGCSDQFIRNCIEDQVILAFQHRPGATGKARCGRRRNYRIHRDCVLLYLLETATYSPSDFLERVRELLRRCPAEDRKSLLA